MKNPYYHKFVAFIKNIRICTRCGCTDAMKPAPKPEPEKKTPPVPIGDVCKNAEGFFTGVGHSTNTAACIKIPLNWPYFNGYTVMTGCTRLSVSTVTASIRSPGN